MESESGGDALTRTDISRYSRQLILPELGVSAQLALKRAAVLIVGAGGLGCPSGTYLASAGVGTIGIVDYDVVEMDNLHRQPLHSESSIGSSKTESFTNSLRALNSSISYVTHNELLTSANALVIVKDYDVVLDCTDNVATRQLVFKTTHKYDVPVSFVVFVNSLEEGPVVSAKRCFRYSQKTLSFWERSTDGREFLLWPRCLDTFITLKYCCTHSGQPTQSFSAIPSPTRLPLFGHLHLFTSLGPYQLPHLYDAYTDLHQRYGPIVSLDLGTKIIALFDPEDISTLFRHEGKFPSRLSFEALKLYRKNHPNKYSSGGLITENGEEWYRLRQACHWMLRPTAAHSFLEVQERVADDFANLVADSRNKNDEIDDFLSFLYRYTEESIGLICFGNRLGLLDSKLSERQSKIVESVNDTLDAMTSTILGFPWWKIFKTKLFVKLERSQNFMYSIAQEYLKQADERYNTCQSHSSFEFLHRLRHKSQLNQKDVGLVVMEIFFAGIDATGNALGFFLYNMARNLQVQEKVYQELEEQVNRPVTPQVLQNLPYLKACMKESHRISATAGGFARILAQDAVFSGYSVPAGVLCIGINPVICRSGQHFDRPLQFRPERWLRDQKQDERRHPFALLPFGHGPRRCIGQRFAEQEMYLCIIKLLLNFRVEYHYEDVGSVLRLQLTPDSPLKFRFVKRR